MVNLVNLQKRYNDLCQGEEEPCDELSDTKQELQLKIDQQYAVMLRCYENSPAMQQLFVRNWTMTTAQYESAPEETITLLARKQNVLDVINDLLAYNLCHEISNGNIQEPPITKYMVYGAYSNVKRAIEQQSDKSDISLPSLMRIYKERSTGLITTYIV